MFEMFNFFPVSIGFGPTWIFVKHCINQKSLLRWKQTWPQEQKADASKGQKLAFQAKVEKKVEKKMPLLSVKKPKTTEVTTEVAKTDKDEKVEPAEMEQKDENKEVKTDGTGGLGIGLAYSDSEEES